MKLVVGIGNIGNGYKYTYHNIGFMTVEKLAKEVGAKFNIEKCKSLIAEASYSGEDFIIAKPTTFVNLSGNAVDELMRKYKIKIKDVIVVVDDIDLAPGMVRYRISGSGGTHNGLRNIVNVTQSQEFKRVKIGAGGSNGEDLATYVLSKIDPHKREIIESAEDKAVEFILSIIAKEVDENVNVSL